MKAQVAKGAAWIAVTRVLVNVIGATSTILLARLLMPADFGIVAIATSVMVIVSSVTEISLSSALVQHEEPNDEHYDTAFTLNLIRALIVSAVTGGLAWPISKLFGDPRLLNLVVVLALTSGMVGLGNPKMATLWRSMKFHQEFTLGIGQKLAGFIAAITFALIYRSYWALVIGAAVSQLVGVMLSYVLVPFRPKLSLSKARELLSFSVWISFSQIVSSLNYRFDDLVIGYFLGRSAIGYYSYGDNLASLATGEVTAPVANTLFAAFSRMNSEKERLRQAYFRSQSLLFAIAMPVGCGFAMIAGPLVIVALGEKWRGAVPVMEVIAAVTAVQTLGMTHYPLAMATAQTRALFRRDLTNLGFRLPIVLVGLAVAGINGVLAARVITGAIALFLNLSLIRQLVGVRLRDQLSANVRPVLATVTMIAVLGIWRLKFAINIGWIGGIVSIVGLILVGGMVYVGTTGLLWLMMKRPNGVERELMLVWRRLFPANFLGVR